ncbi:MAG: LysM peptidoglycan-binding domain-containing protein [Candidatus Methylomirabilales bacterium]
MQWRWSIPLTALFVLTLVTPLRADNHWDPVTGSSLPVEALHKVEASDNLHLLAAYYYGDARQWYRIYEANRRVVKDRNLIHPGQILRINLSPGWTPLEKYAEWKTRVREGVYTVKMPPFEEPEHQSMEETGF